MKVASEKVYFVYANPAASEAIGAYLAAQGRVSESETTILEVEGKEYPCWQIRGSGVKFVKQYVEDKPDIATNVRLFERHEGQGKNAHDVSFMLRKQRHVRQAVLKETKKHVIQGQGPTRDRLIKTAR